MSANNEPSIWTVFLDSFERLPKDSTLKELPVDSGCGDECMAVINATLELLKLCDPVSHHEIIDGAEHAISVKWRA